MTEISIVIPIFDKEQVPYVYETLKGIDKTIGVDPWNYTITIVGTVPLDMFKGRNLPSVKWNYIPAKDLGCGGNKNEGAKYVMTHYSPNVIVFIDAHMKFFDNESKNWGILIYNFLMSRPNTVVAPSGSVYNDPGQRGYGMIPKITNTPTEYYMRSAWINIPEPQNRKIPIEIPGTGGAFMCMTPATFNKSIIGFTPLYGADDVEFSLRMWTLGVDFYCLPEIIVGHQYHDRIPSWGKELSINWGTSMLLFHYLNLDPLDFDRFVKLGIASSQDPQESLRRVVTPYWQQVRREIASKRVRTYQEYYTKYRKMIK